MQIGHSSRGGRSGRGPRSFELASSFLENLLDGLALLLMLPPVFVLTLLVTVPNALAGPALHEGVTLLAARRTHLGRAGPTFCVWLGTVLLSFHRFAECHCAELLSRGRCSGLFS